MKKYLSLFFLSLIIWFIPLLVSFGFYDQNGNMVSNYLVFKVTMVLVSTFVSFFVLRGFYRRYRDSSVVQNSLLIILIQIILDIPVLIITLKMDPLFYAYSVVPVYLIMIPLVNLYISKKIGR